MKIKEIQNPNTVLVPQTTRNKKIGDILPPIPQTNWTGLIIGAPNSGKSVLCESLLKKQLYQMYDSVIVVSPSTSRDCFKGSVLKQVDKKKQFSSLTESNLFEIEEMIVSTRDEGKEQEPEEYWSTLLYMDDIQHEYKSSALIESTVRSWLANHRHLHLTVVLTLQNTIAISKASRELFRVVMLFPTSSRKEIMRIHDEFLGKFKTEEVRRLLKHVWDKKHQFLFIDRQEGLICKNFNKLEIKLDDDEEDETNTETDED